MVPTERPLTRCWKISITLIHPVQHVPHSASASLRLRSGNNFSHGGHGGGGAAPPPPPPPRLRFLPPLAPAGGERAPALSMLCVFVLYSLACGGDGDLSM